MKEGEENNERREGLQQCELKKGEVVSIYGMQMDYLLSSCNPIDNYKDIF